jgi:hypothetical protein
MCKRSSLLIIVISLSGCTSIKAMFAMVKSADDFIALEANPSIQYEHGSDAFAKIISLYVKSSIQTIENRQGTFQETVTIYVPGTLDHFADHCTSTLPSACVVSDRLSMSPNILDQQERISGIPAHELSHLQLTQTVGFWNYQLKIPSWFKEGLAVYVSNGAGAEQVGKTDAIEAIKQVKAIIPNGTGSLLFRKTASRFGL